MRAAPGEGSHGSILNGNYLLIRLTSAWKSTFITFYALLRLFGASEALFQTGWFIESITTPILVVFAISTRRVFFRSQPHRLLMTMAFGAIAVAIAIPMLPIGSWFGFVTPPPLFFAYLIGATVIYLTLVELAKNLFYVRFAKHSS